MPKLYGWFPNPFNSYTTFKYDLPENSFVNITIRDLLGRHVRTLINQFQDSGSKSVNWNATNANNAPIPSGIYFCTLKMGQFEGITKLILLK